MEFDQLKLSNQLCFPFYAASRLITREYQPLLAKLGLTYPQYLVLLVLWEDDSISVNEITTRLLLNTNTITPLLKRMETMELIKRDRSDTDERKVIIRLTPKGKELQVNASSIPGELISGLKDARMSNDQLIELCANLNNLIDYFKQKGKSESKDIDK